MKLQAPFPWFGGKSTVADMVWERLGDTQNYVEPFFGSGAVMLLRPHEPKLETINDRDALVANFWRSIKTDPEGTSKWADNPVNEADLHARHLWIVQRLQNHHDRMIADPEYYDPRMAGYWVYGVCAWIGSGFASGKGPWVAVEDEEGYLTIANNTDTGKGIKRKIPNLGNAGNGINRQIPNLGNGKGINRQIPNLGSAGNGIHRQLLRPYNNRGEFIYQWFRALSERLSNVRVCCGNWDRVMGESVTVKNGLTSVFLDPPYGAVNRDMLYRVDSYSVAQDVLEWCIENGDNKLLRIALCGYDGEGHGLLEDKGWSVVAWRANGGYANQGNNQGRINAKRERIWFSPHCLKANILF